MSEEITLKNTIAEVLEALNKPMAREEQAEKLKLNPEKLDRDKTEKREIMGILNYQPIGDQINVF